MKKTVLLGVLASIVLLAGCGENPKLTACQQEKADLQTQLDQANEAVQTKEAALAEKEATIDKLKADNTEVQKKALESIRTIMQKENKAKVDAKKKLDAEKVKVKELQQKESELQQKVKKLQQKAAELEAEVTAQKAAAEAAKKAAETAAGEASEGTEAGN